ncbi:hypothetical protein AB204_19895, partial [Xenorhabdus khoisanae]
MTITLFLDNKMYMIHPHVKWIQKNISFFLSHWGDNEKNDIKDKNQHVLTAHCDAKGKMWSNLRLFRRGEGFAYIERHSVLDTQLTELKKYAVFSKVTFAKDDESVLLGVAGTGSRKALATFFPD